jgi:uncharacterized Tic20 family protein
LQATFSIPPEQRTLAAMTHLSGLAGYIIPLGGVLVPIILWVVKSDSPLISTIAKQALLLNVVVFVLVGASFLLWLTILLIPIAILIWVALGIAAIVLPIVGAVRSWDGVYYRYPWIGLPLA